MAWNQHINSRKLKLQVATTVAGTYSVVGRMNAFEKTVNTSTESVPTYDTTTDISEPGTNEKSYRVDGLMVPDDAGQLIIRNAIATGTTVFVKVLPMGNDANATENVRGWTHECRIGSVRYSAPLPGIQRWGFDLLSVADEVVSGVGGYII